MGWVRLENTSTEGDISAAKCALFSENWEFLLSNLSFLAHMETVVWTFSLAGLGHSI